MKIRGKCDFIDVVDELAIARLEKRDNFLEQRVDKIHEQSGSRLRSLGS